MLDFGPYQESIRSLCRALGVKRLEVFGSAVREDFQESSDLDFLLTFSEGSNEFHRYFELKFELENLFHRKVDLVMEEGLNNPLLLTYIDREKRTLFQELTAKLNNKVVVSCT